MNRYAAKGLLEQAAEGKRIVIVAHTSRAARVAFDEVLALAEHPSRVCHANGLEEIRFHTGGRVRFTGPGSGLRAGDRHDVVFVDGPAADCLIDRFVPDLRAAGAEIVRA